MAAGRIATVTPVSEESATGKVAAVFADIKATKNIPSCRTSGVSSRPTPDHLELVWTRLKAIMHPEACGRVSKLDPLTREIIALAVSATNGCSYCVNSHTAAVSASSASTRKPPAK